MSVLLIPVSFDFVNALCIAAVLGFISDKGDEVKNVNFRQLFSSGSSEKKVAVYAGENEHKRDCEVGLSAQPVPTEDTAVTEGVRAGHRQTDRRYTLMHISSAPETPVRVGRQGREGPIEPSKNNVPLQLYGARRFLKNISQRTTVSISGSRRSSGSRWSLASESTATLAAASRETKLKFGGSSTSLHWGLALAAVLQLVLSAISDQLST